MRRLGRHSTLVILDAMAYSSPDSHAAQLFCYPPDQTAESDSKTWANWATLLDGARCVRMLQTSQPLLSLSALPLPLRWGCAVGMVLLAFAAHCALFGLGPRFPYLLFFPAVIAAAVVLGRGSGIFAALSSAALAVCFFVPRIGSLSLADPIDALGATLYLAIAVFIAWIVEALPAAYGAEVKARAESE